MNLRFFVAALCAPEQRTSQPISVRGIHSSEWLASAQVLYDWFAKSKRTQCVRRVLARGINSLLLFPFLHFLASSDSFATKKEKFRIPLGQ